MTSTNRPVRVNASTRARRCGVVVFDADSARRPQQPGGQVDDAVDDRHAVRPAEQRMRRIMFGHFGFQCRTVGDVRRIGHDEVDGAVELGKQARLGHVGMR